MATASHDFVRVSKRNPCPVCGRPDWCTMTDRLALCMRVPSPHRARNGAYIHPLDSGPPPRSEAEPETRLTPREIAARYARLRECRLSLNPAAEKLGLAPEVMREYGAVAYTLDGDIVVPMYDVERRIIGMRVRRADGRKLSWRGSRNGLFLPGQERMRRAPLVVCEGPTDAMAAAQAGFAGIGRPDCASRPELVADLAVAYECHRLALCPDGDTPGRRGALRLVRILEQRGLRAVIVHTPDGCKDVRAWVAKDPRDFADRVRRALDTLRAGAVR